MILLCLLLPMLGIVSTKNTYLVTVPKDVRPGSVADISITSSKNLKQIQISAWFMDSKNKVLSTVTQSFTNQVTGKPKIARLQIPKVIPMNINGGFDNSFKIRVKATGDLKFDKTATKIGINSKASSIFIQTDRPLYKPGDLVQFRIFGTNPALKVLDDALNITIEDPKRNRLQQFIDVKPVFGVFSESFQLSSLTTLGQWTIAVEQLNEKNTKSFTVEQYVLPKFEVNIATPSFELKTDRFFVATITAMYTFGKPVAGEVYMKIKRRWGSDSDAIEKTFAIKGKATLRILMSELKITYQSSVEIFARVKESVTGKEINTTQYVTIYDTPEKMTFSSSMPDVFKPGLDYNIALRITQQDDTPLKQRLGYINVTATYRVLVPRNETSSAPAESGDQVMAGGRIRPEPQQYEEKTLWSRNVNITESGIIEMVARFPKSAESGNIQANYRMSSASQWVTRAESPSKNYMQVTFPGDKEAKAGENLPLEIKTTEGIQSCNYKVFSKGALLTQGKFNMNNKKVMRHQLMITNAMAPQAMLLLYYTRRNGEIVADAATIAVADIFKNKVSLSFNKERVKPNEEVALKISADPQSLVSVLAVDKSIMLMKTGNDITSTDVFNELKQYGTPGPLPDIGTWDFRIPRPVYGKDAFSIFNSAGVYVLTDFYLYQYIPEARSQRSGTTMFMAKAGGGFAMEDAGPSANGGGGGGELATPSRTRTNFPETWLWINRTTGADGTVTVTANAPDTITQWITSAFAVNSNTGLGVVSGTANVTTYQEFFMRMELPYSVIRGEIIILQISVFNFLPQNAQVVVKLNKNDGFDFVDANGSPFNPGTDGWNKSVTVDTDGVNSVFFPIKPKMLGKIKLTASARSTAAADAVERELLVEAEGKRQTYNVPLLIDLRNKNNFNDIINITFPQKRVQGSEFIKLQLIGDIMGPTLANLENLLQVPSGSGEQNMVNFAPNAYVSSYLKATNRLTGDIKTRVSNYLEAGYQRELSFVHFDGSFSAFGTSDISGSTWLTALVVKSFAQAAEFTFIDKNVMTKALQWLLRQQTPDGDFSEAGLIHQKVMQGGTPSSKRSLTAFVLIALQEAKTKDQVEPSVKQNVDSAITKATSFIAKGAPVSIANLYELGIVAYALTLVNHPSKDQLFSVLEKKATIKDGEKYWSLSKIDADIIQPWKNWSPPGEEFKSVDVELTSYALLIYNDKNDMTESIKVLKWLTRQRQSIGGFVSTMDTIVAVQALAGLGAKLTAPNLNADVTVKGGTWPGKAFKINRSNSLVLNTVDAPKTLRSVSVEASGTGISLVEAAVSFNVLEELRDPAFRLNFTILNDSIKGFKLRPCFSWKKVQQSTMGLLEISIPTGMEADLDTLDTTQTGGFFKKVEKAFRQINLFFDAITTKEMCVEVRIDRVNLVARHKAVPIRLSEMSEPSNEATVFYESQALSGATIVEVCGAEKCIEVKKK